MTEVRNREVATIRERIHRLMPTPSTLHERQRCLKPTQVRTRLERVQYLTSTHTTLHNDETHCQIHLCFNPVHPPWPPPQPLPTAPINLKTLDPNQRIVIELLDIFILSLQPTLTVLLARANLPATLLTAPANKSRKNSFLISFRRISLSLRIYRL
ncbi:hypothetical protein BC829DRAFT_233388 [Chytridium lagenaria]|nr:hypothetical protein BC829DRAFT_233388 [Chytridium lagenaria]